MSEDIGKKRHPAFWVPTLYTSEGLPFVIVNVVTVLMYKSMGLSDAKITFFTGIIAIPWLLKPLWGPILEMFRTKKDFVIFTQMFGGVVFGMLAMTLPMENFFQWSLAFLGIIAINFAIHDTAADGVYINVLNSKEQAQYVGWQGAFYNVGKFLSQGAFVILAGYLEKTVGVTEAWMIVMGAFGLILFLLGVYHIKMLPSGGKAGEVKTINEAVTTFVDVVETFFQKKYILWGIAFLVLYRFAEGQAIKIVPLFMKADVESGGLGLSTLEVGVVYGIFPIIAFILGSLLAGYFTASRGLKKTLLILCAGFNIPFAVYVVLAMLQPESRVVITVLMTFEYLGYGFGFIGLTLFMMQQIAPGKYKMAHYAFATSLMQLGMLIPSSISGLLSDWMGYQNFFIWVMVATIPSFLITWLVPFRDTSEDEALAKTEE